MNTGILIFQNHTKIMDLKPKEKVMSYEEKSVGSTPFFKCEACPYMALAEDDIKFHLFTAHPELAKSNGLADNIQIPCPGCANVFDAEETLRTHLRNHHKMGIKDVKKMIKSLVQIALKNAKLKKEVPPTDTTPDRQEVPDVKIPQVIEIVPDVSHTNIEQMPKGVAFISVDELNKMSAPNFEKVDPKEVIQEASINIVYTNEISQYLNVSNSNIPNSPCNVMQVSSVTPDLISSIQPCPNMSDSLSPAKKEEQSQITDQRIAYKYNERKTNIDPEKSGILCSVNKCHIRLKDLNNLSYHRKCHQNGKLQCPECGKVFLTVDQCHTHLWKIHAIDVELPTCVVCGYKTFKRHRLLNIHMKCHDELRGYTCSICSKFFKNPNQLSKHRLIHKVGNAVECHICKRQFNNQPRLKAHIAAVHDKLKPFKCCHCDYTAARKEELKLHLRSHTGDKPYACDQCSYRSADHNAMRRHKKVHSKDVVYKCKYCPYSSIQSTVFATHMLSKHPNINSSDIHYCPYCPFKSVNEDKYIVHLTTHRDKEGMQMLVEITKNKNKPSWTIPSDATEQIDNEDTVNKDMNTDNNEDANPKTVNKNPIEVYDCDSLPETMPQEYPKKYCTSSSNTDQLSNFNDQDMVTDLSKDDNNSDCLISESSNDTMIDRHQFNSQHSLQMPYGTAQANLHYLSTSVSMEQTLLQSANVDSLATNHSPIANSISNNIMANFPIRLPPAPISMRNNITLKPVDRISIPMPKIMGPIIKPSQILPVPSSCHSPIHIISNDNDGVPRKKAKISVKSNLILKGPDQVNMFHSQQKMAFKQLEDNERYGLSSPVTFNNLISTQFMQLPPEPVLSESPNNIMTYAQENMLGDTATTPVDSELTDDPQIFSFNQQIKVNAMTMLPPPQKIQTNDPSYIKLEATIKQNTQSPSLERMCNANLLTNNPALSREYKASPPLEDIHKNMNEIKNELKSDAFYTMPLTNAAANPPIIDQYLIDNIIPEQYPAHLDLSAVVMPELADHQNDIIEIDDNSDDNKLLPRFDMNFPLESLYLMQNDFHFLENDIQMNNSSEIVNEINRMVVEVPIINQKENIDMTSNELNSDFPNYIQGKKDPMMNTSVRPSTNKINVKNIELMKN